jgi:predicted MPP superfamily phosphohydrolase
MRRLFGLLVAAALAGLAVLALAYAEATRTPGVVTYDVASPAWTGPPVSIALLADAQAAHPDMPPARIARIVQQTNALKADIVLLAGDYVTGRLVQSGRVGPAAATAPFAGLRAPLGVFAVLGNHDMERPGLAEEVTAGLEAAGVTVLRNRAARAGPLWVAGVDDNRHGVTGVTAAMAGVPPGAPLLYLVHNPDNLVDTPARVGLTLAGHSHGGQVLLPFVGALVLPIERRDWARGHIVWPGPDGQARHMVVTSGLGTSGAPIRLGVPPEIVLVRLRGAPDGGA